MKQYFKYYLLLLVFGCNIGFTAPMLNKNSYWQCITQDSGNKLWYAKNAYQKAALNIAFAACKKESKTPSTCRASVADCDGYNQGRSTKPMWQCTALDKTAEPWQSNFYSQPDDAALGAKAFCKQKSTVPDTCYINLVTCMNYNSRDRM